MAVSNQSELGQVSHNCLPTFFLVKNIFMICACKNCLIHQGKNKICFAVTFDNCYQRRLNSLLKNDKTIKSLPPCTS